MRWLLGAIFLAAGLLKVVHPADFHSSLLVYQTGLPDNLLRLVAVWLPWVEMLCGAALLADAWTETAVLLVAAMSLVFVLMLGQAVWRGLDFNCGCFGSVTPAWFDGPRVALFRTGVLLSASVWLWLRTALRRGEAAQSTA